MTDIVQFWDYLRQLADFCLFCGTVGCWASAEGIGYRWHQCQLCRQGYWIGENGQAFPLDENFGG